MDRLYTSFLEVAFLERGPAGGPVMLLLHGFMDDATAWIPAMNALADCGIRTVAPYMRGFGPTRFRDEGFPRYGNTAALTLDVLDIMDVLRIDCATLVGHGWGARTAQGLAALFPERVAHLVTFGGYALAMTSKDMPPNYPTLQAQWYEHLLHTPLGKKILEQDISRFAKYLWEIWSPNWDPTERNIALASVVRSFSNPDFVAIVSAIYTGRCDNVFCADLEATLSEGPKVTVPTTIIRGGLDPLDPNPHVAADGASFAEIKQNIKWADAGHLAHREMPAAVSRVLMNTI
jgi:pimeloyl-ACP methyl ester carboxylesterase